MAKITRENRVRERRLEKEAKKAARKLAAAADQPRPGDEPAAQDAPERDQ